MRVAEYDYTCIFEYAQGQKTPPQESGPPQAAPPAAVQGTQEPGLLSFADVAVGDRLTELSISESQDVISQKDSFRLAGRRRDGNIHTDEAFAKQNIFGGRVNAGPSTMSYVDQMLQLSFPLQAFYEGGSLLMRAIEPFRAGDTVVFQGEVTSKRREGDKDLVECRVKGVNQHGALVCLSDAVMAMPG
jgi:acyl dehydratase